VNSFDGSLETICASHSTQTVVTYFLFYHYVLYLALYSNHYHRDRNRYNIKDYVTSNRFV